MLNQQYYIGSATDNQVKEKYNFEELKRVVIRATCRVKLTYQKSTKELMQLQGVTVPIKRMIRAAACEMVWTDFVKREG